MQKSMLFPVVAALLVSGLSMADDVKTTAQKTGDALGVRNTSGGAAKYGPAGCGLGSMIFKPDSGFTQIFAATTNGSSGNQTFGITSGTSNCDTGAGGSASAKVFIQANREALSKDIAKGGGETITSLSTLAGCQDATAVGATLQKNFKAIFPTSAASTDSVSTSIMSTLRTEKSLACTNAS